MAKPAQVMVTLKRAQTYIHQPSGLRFEHDESRIVSNETADYLYRNATRSVKIKSGGQITRDEVRLFDFAPVDSDEDMDDAEAAEAEDTPETLADMLAKTQPVKADAAAQKPDPVATGAASGGAGQARSRARGTKGGQANT